MSVKNNAALSIDRESIAALATYSQALATEVNNAKAEVTTIYTYFCGDDPGVEGGKTEDFKKSVKAVHDMLVDLSMKMDNTHKTVAKVAETFGAVQSRADIGLSEAKQNMGEAIMKLKSVGKK